MRDQWSSRLGFLLAAIGASVGVGNIWRFPYLVGQDGGGAFLIPYMVGIILVGLPMVLLEVGAGVVLRAGPITAFSAAWPRFGRWPGLVVTVGSLALFSYYLVITGWTLAYTFHSARGGAPSFAEFTSSYETVGWFLLVLALQAAVVMAGVRRGVELLARVAVPALVVLMVALAVYATTLPGFRAGIEFYLRPDPERLADPRVWLNAFGQVFFSLGVGMGVFIVYGSYLKPGSEVRGPAIATAMIDTMVALVAGLIIFPMVFTLGAEPGAGQQLAFDTLPHIFAGITGGRLAAVVFYGLLFLAAFTSAVSLLELGVVSARELRPSVSRRGAVGVLVAIIAVAGMPSALSYTPAAWSAFGEPVFDRMDTLVGTLGLPFGVLITAAVIGFSARARDVQRAIYQRTSGYFARSWLVLVRYVVPAALAAVYVGLVLDVVRPG